MWAMWIALSDSSGILQTSLSTPMSWRTGQVSSMRWIHIRQVSLWWYDQTVQMFWILGIVGSRSRTSIVMRFLIFTFYFFKQQQFLDVWLVCMHHLVVYVCTCALCAVMYARLCTCVICMSCTWLPDFVVIIIIIILRTICCCFFKFKLFLRVCVCCLLTGMQECLVIKC